MSEQDRSGCGCEVGFGAWVLRLEKNETLVVLSWWKTGFVVGHDELKPVATIWKSLLGYGESSGKQRWNASWPRGMFGLVGSRLARFDMRIVDGFVPVTP